MTRHTYPCPVRWSDMDAYGVVNNVSLLRYLEEPGRLHLPHGTDAG